MAKNRIKEQLKIEEIKEEKSPGIFQKLFYLVLIPLLFVVAILLVIASFTNFNVFEKASELTNSLPFASDKKSEEFSLDFDEKIVELEAEIKEKEAEIDQLKSQLDKANLEAENNLAKQQQLQNQIESLEKQQSESKKEFNEILSTFKQMSAKTAAPIIMEMSDDKAIKILSNMDPETLSAILSKMEPKEAARYTELISQ
ncbi:MotE family protein [Ureibacillus endophyticus]|uniref:Magnesium transporter MgtE intracellular domain-containing protein n=1 Tax=Ureibacillus endophyticus TaxID=1978490 RepID=A0A494ZAX6_9BACL|nr:hypothetical protein [Lysinibacillus endophyticus]RKQ19795.1 hypothetical protein D8M03_01875 [Lysinibacillus endophyticus]